MTRAIFLLVIATIALPTDLYNPIANGTEARAGARPESLTLGASKMLDRKAKLHIFNITANNTTVLTV